MICLLMVWVFLRVFVSSCLCVQYNKAASGKILYTKTQRHEEYKNFVSLCLRVQYIKPLAAAKICVICVICVLSIQPLLLHSLFSFAVII
jgi:hypothetical protein